MIVSHSNLSGRPVTDSDQGTFGGSPLGTSISKGNVGGALPRPQESGTINKCPRNALTQKEEKVSRWNRSLTQFSGVLLAIVKSQGNHMEYIKLF